MKINEAEKLCKELILKHKLNYKVAWDNSKRCFGYCDNIAKEIGLSTVLVELNSVTEVRKTILHEIAHALTPKHDHDKVWKAKCKEIGGDGITRYKGNVELPYKYLYECPKCKLRYRKLIRVTKGNACGTCCKKHNNGKYDKQYELNEVKTNGK